MANFAVGDTVLVPAQALGLSDPPFALVEREVKQVTGRSVRVDTQGGASVLVGTQRVHEDFGVLLLCLGDFDTEPSLLDPMMASLHAYTSLLVPGDRVQSVKVRTVQEFTNRAKHLGGMATHVIVVGHCDGESFLMAEGVPLTGEAFVESFDEPKKTILSLACSSGRTAIGRSVARGSACREYVAPHQEVHGAAAVQYCTAYLTALLLDGRSPGRALSLGLGAIPRATHFRRFTADGWWRLGP